MAEITQHIGTVRTLADAPNPLTDKEEVFDQKGYAYTQSQKEVNADIQARITELNTFAEQANLLAESVNTLKDETQAIKEDVVLSANTATTKAEEASESATNARNAQLAAEAALDNFDDRYLGAKATPPTLDNDGNPLISGAMYWNSTNNTMYVRDATLNQWISLSFVPTDHGGLTGLGDDDHTQYHNDARGDARYYKKEEVDTALGTKQATLVSGTNIKTVNGSSVLGSGDITVGTKTINDFVSIDNVTITAQEQQWTIQGAHLISSSGNDYSMLVILKDLSNALYVTTISKTSGIVTRGANFAFSGTQHGTVVNVIGMTSNRVLVRSFFGSGEKFTVVDYTNISSIVIGTTVSHANTSPVGDKYILMASGHYVFAGSNLGSNISLKFCTVSVSGTTVTVNNEVTAYASTNTTTSVYFTVNDGANDVIDVIRVDSTEQYYAIQLKNTSGTLSVSGSLSPSTLINNSSDLLYTNIATLKVANGVYLLPINSSGSNFGVCRLTFQQTSTIAAPTAVNHTKTWASSGGAPYIIKTAVSNTYLIVGTSTTNSVGTVYFTYNYNTNVASSPFTVTYTSTNLATDGFYAPNTVYLTEKSVDTYTPYGLLDASLTNTVYLCNTFRTSLIKVSISNSTGYISSLIVVGTGDSASGRLVNVGNTGLYPISQYNNYKYSVLFDTSTETVIPNAFHDYSYRVGSTFFGYSSGYFTILKNKVSYIVPTYDFIFSVGGLTKTQNSDICLFINPITQKLHVIKDK